MKKAITPKQEATIDTAVKYLLDPKQEFNPLDGFCDFYAIETCCAWNIISPQDLYDYLMGEIDGAVDEYWYDFGDGRLPAKFTANVIKKYIAACKKWQWPLTNQPVLATTIPTQKSEIALLRALGFVKKFSTKNPATKNIVTMWELVI